MRDQLFLSHLERGEDHNNESIQYEWLFTFFMDHSQIAPILLSIFDGKIR